MCMSVLIECVLCILCASLEGNNREKGSRTVGSSESSRAEDGKIVGGGGGEPETES